MIQLATGFEVLTSLPLDSRNLMSKAEMLTANDNVFPDYFLTQCLDDGGKLYLYNKANATPSAETGKFTPLEDSFSPNIQMEAMPVAGADELGKIYQYIGADTAQYKKGFWYTCMSGTSSIVEVKLFSKYVHDTDVIYVDDEDNAYLNGTDDDPTSGTPITVTQGTDEVEYNGDTYTLDDTIDIETSSTSGSGYSWVRIDVQPKVEIEVLPEDETTEGYLKTYDFRYDGNSIGKIDIPKELVVTNGSVKKITVEKVDEADPESYIYTISFNGNTETYTKADTEDEESDYYMYPIAESTYIVLGIQNQSYPIFIDAKAVVSDTLGTVTETVTANCVVGAMEIGDTIEEGADITEVVKKLLIKYYAPEIVLTATPANKVVEIGETVSVNLSAAVTKKSEPITKVAFYKDADVLEEVTTSVEAGGTFTNVAGDITTTTTFKATVTDGKKTNESKVIYKFVHPYYYGVVNSKESIDVTGLTKLVEDKSKKSLYYVSNNQFAVFAYDATYPDLTSILDASSFENLSSFDKQTVSVGGINYKVYVGKTPLTSASGFQYTFI